jgi:broad specificity phosphatase PhoE
MSTAAPLMHRTYRAWLWVSYEHGSGYAYRMTEPLRDLEHKVEQTVEELAHEAEEGESARTPLIVLSGVTIFVAGVVTILLVVAFTAYYLNN